MVKLTKYEVTQMRIKRIEKEIRDTPYHKGTEHHIGRLRARLSKLKDDLETPSGKKGGGGGYAVKKQGDATVVLIGPPSSGKSTLLNKLTNAKSKVAPYEFTTLTVIPGMMEFKDAKIQILDVPGLIEGAEEGKGRGREVLSVTRGTNLVVLITDVKRVNAIKRISETLERNGIRINQKPPDVLVEKKLSGGIVIHSNIKQTLSKQTIKDIAQEMGIKNAEITIKEKLTIERLIDALSSNRVYIQSFILVNKIDLLNNQVLTKYYYDSSHQNEIIFISAEKGMGIDEFKEKIWQKLEFVRVFLVRPDEEPNFNHAIIMKKGNTLYDVTLKIGEEFSEGKTRAKIWGVGSKFPGQEVSLSKEIQEGLQVRFI